MKKDKTLLNIKESLEEANNYQVAGDIQMAESCQNTANILIKMVMVFRGMTKEEVLSKATAI